MNSLAFGPPTWNFLHAVPWLYPKEILTMDDAAVAIRFTHNVILILPCRYCRASGAIFQKEIGQLQTMTISTKNYRIVTRSSWAKYLFILHNRVNAKLEKPLFGKSWIDAVKDRPNWKDSMWAFLFAVAWNYPVENPTPQWMYTHLTFFGDLLPAVLKHTDVGSNYEQMLESQPLTKTVLSSRVLFTRWLYEIRCGCNTSCKVAWDFDFLNTFYEGFRARSSACSINVSKEQEAAEAEQKKTCQ